MPEAKVVEINMIFRLRHIPTVVRGDASEGVQ